MPAHNPDAASTFHLAAQGRTVRAARLLAEIGDCRVRCPTPESLICLASVAPSTRQSGKHKNVTFRWGADKQLRDAVCDFIPCSPQHSQREWRHLDLMKARLKALRLSNPTALPRRGRMVHVRPAWPWPA